MEAYDCGDDGNDDASETAGEYGAGATRRRPFLGVGCGVVLLTALLTTADGDALRPVLLDDLATTAIDDARLTRSSVSSSS